MTATPIAASKTMRQQVVKPAAGQSFDLATQSTRRWRLARFNEPTSRQLVDALCDFGFSRCDWLHTLDGMEKDGSLQEWIDSDLDDE